MTCFVVPGLGNLPPGVTLSPTGTLSGTPTTPGNYVFTVECVDSGPPERRDRQTLTIQVNPASPVGFDALWNGLDSNWYNPANWSPRGVPAETSRVYFSAATSVVPRLTANVTVRDLFLEPGATLDTNGFTLTVTNNADAGRTIIGLGQTVLTGNGSTAAGVFSNLAIAGRITLSAPLTTTGTLTLAPGARLELNGQPLIVGGQLITNVTEGALPMIVGARREPVHRHRRERQRPGAERRAAHHQRRRAHEVRQRLVQRLRARSDPADGQQSRACSRTSR